MTQAVPRKVAGTTIEYKTTSGGSYTALTKAFSRQIPTPKFGLDDTTGLDDAVVTMDPTIADYGDCILSIVYDPENTAHKALYDAAAAGNTIWLKFTVASGRTIEFSGPAYEFGDKASGPKDHQRNDFKMRCNVVPTITAPTP